MFRRKDPAFISVVYRELAKSAHRIGKRMLRDIKARIYESAKVGYREFYLIHHYVSDGPSQYGAISQDVMDVVQKRLENEGFNDVSCEADKQGYSVLVRW